MGRGDKSKILFRVEYIPSFRNENNSFPISCRYKLTSSRASAFSSRNNISHCGLIFSCWLDEIHFSLSSMSGADIVGVNCKFDPTTSIKTLILMKEALDKEGLSPHLIIQPVGYHTPDAGRAGFASLPELPFGKKLILKSWLCVYLMLRHVIIGYLI